MIEVKKTKVEGSYKGTEGAFPVRISQYKSDKQMYKVEVFHRSAWYDHDDKLTLDEAIDIYESLVRLIEA